MRRFLPKSLNQVLLAAIPVALVAAWLTGHWTLGAAVALGAMCGLAVRNSSQETDDAAGWRESRSKKKAASSPTETSARPPAPPPPPRRRASADNNSSPVERMVAQGRVALLLRP